MSDTLARRDEVVRFFGWGLDEEEHEPLAPVADTDFHTADLE
jgi:hypothetical protein